MSHFTRSLEDAEVLANAHVRLKPILLSFGSEMVWAWASTNIDFGIGKKGSIELRMHYSPKRSPCIVTRTTDVSPRIPHI